jgi:hypothetical protein
MSALPRSLSIKIRNEAKAHDFTKITITLQQTSPYMFPTSLDRHQTAYNCTTHFGHERNAVTNRFAIPLKQVLQT